MLCLTFDTDHMDEQRMAEFLATVDIPGTGTFFCTQKYDCLDATPHELAPHPTLPSGTDWRVELLRMREMFPAARGWRAHSCVFSNLLAEWLGSNGYRYVSANAEFGCKGIKPLREPWGVWHFPIFYMDTMDFSSACFWGDQADPPFSDSLIETALGDDGVYVLDFHPIHLLLNTPNRDHYFSMRDLFRKDENLNRIVHSGIGTKSFYDALGRRMRERNIVSVSLAEALEVHLARKDPAQSLSLGNTRR